MYRLTLFFLAILFSSQVRAQEKFGAFAGVNFGSFAPATDNFDQVYDGRFVIPEYKGGVGYKWFYLVARFKNISLEGDPMLVNPATFTTPTANWNQSVAFITARLYKYTNFLDLYGEIGVVNTSAKETITVPNSPRLSSEETKKASGAGLVLGVEKTVFKYVAINVEMEWTNARLKENLDGFAGNQPNLGGLLFGAGLSLQFRQ